MPIFKPFRPRFDCWPDYRFSVFEILARLRARGNATLRPHQFLGRENYPPAFDAVRIYALGFYRIFWSRGMK